MTAASKNLGINKLDDIVGKYNNTYRTTKMKPNDVEASTYIDFDVETNDRDLKLKLLIMWEYQNIKTFLLNFTHKF